jgi:tetratricopeptide (TPR) repeat protein
MNTDDFPEILEARAYSGHRDYAAALEIYGELLPTLNQDELSYSYILLEYALCLLESVNYDAEMNYQRLLEKKNPIPMENMAEDIEICWDSLEICRSTFEIINDQEKLCLTHKGLGDILSFNNDFTGAIGDYKKAIEYCDKDDNLIELLECIADCYKHMKDYNSQKEYYGKIIDIHKSKGNTEMIAELEDYVSAIDTIRNSSEEKKAVVTNNSEPTNINHLKKNKN